MKISPIYTKCRHNFRSIQSISSHATVVILLQPYIVIQVPTGEQKSSNAVDSSVRHLEISYESDLVLQLAEHFQMKTFTSRSYPKSIDSFFCHSFGLAHFIHYFRCYSSYIVSEGWKTRLEFSDFCSCCQNQSDMQRTIITNIKGKYGIDCHRFYITY